MQSHLQNYWRKKCEKRHQDLKITGYELHKLHVMVTFEVDEIKGVQEARLIRGSWEVVSIEEGEGTTIKYFLDNRPEVERRAAGVWYQKNHNKITNQGTCDKIEKFIHSGY